MTRLGSFDMHYRPRNLVKGQILANFVAEFTPRRETEVVCHVETWLWKVFVDGASSAMGVGVGVVLVIREGIRVEHSF